MNFLKNKFLLYNNFKNTYNFNITTLTLLSESEELDFAPVFFLTTTAFALEVRLAFELSSPFYKAKF